MTNVSYIIYTSLQHKVRDWVAMELMNKASLWSRDQVRKKLKVNELSSVGLAVTIAHRSKSAYK